MVTVFKINATDIIVGKTQRAPTGFKHVVEYRRNGNLIASRQVSYYNRTWESFEYETAITALLEKMGLPQAEKMAILKTCAEIANGKSEAMFHSTAMIAKLGDVFGTTKKEKNDWKTRMLKAGLGGAGLQIPEDWDALSEDEKEGRLNKVIEYAKKTKMGR